MNTRDDAAVAAADVQAEGVLLISVALCSFGNPFVRLIHLPFNMHQERYMGDLTEQWNAKRYRTGSKKHHVEVFSNRIKFTQSGSTQTEVASSLPPFPHDSLTMRLVLALAWSKSSSYPLKFHNFLPSQCGEGYFFETLNFPFNFQKTLLNRMTS